MYTHLLQLETLLKRVIFVEDDSFQTFICLSREKNILNSRRILLKHVVHSFPTFLCFVTLVNRLANILGTKIKFNLIVYIF